jgi:hypothetical protein
MQTMFYIALFIRPGLPISCSLYLIEMQKVSSVVAPCAMLLNLSSYFKSLILAISPYHQAHWISRNRKSVSYLLERGTPS